MRKLMACTLPSGTTRTNSNAIPVKKNNDIVVILRPVKRNITTGTKYEGKSTKPVMPT